MELTGRITRDAQVKRLLDGRDVVTFSIAINDYYKTKDGEKHEDVTYFNCSYWISSKVATSLGKGSIVSLFGRVGLNSYKDMQGDFHASLTFHVNHIKIVARPKNEGATSKQNELTPANKAEGDLPF